MKVEFYFNISPKKTLIKFSLFAVVALNLLGIIYLWWNNSHYYVINPEGGNIFIALGRLAGLLGAFTLLVQISLVGRTKWIEGIFGFDKLNKLHRFIGYSILLLLLGHPLLLIVGYSEINSVSYISQLADFLANWKDVLKSFFALLIFGFIIVFSIAIIRHKLKYETWYFVHLATYLGLILAFSHQVNTGDLSKGYALYYWYTINILVVGVFLLYRFLRPLYLFARHRFKIDRVIEESPGTWSIYITGAHMDKFYFNAGQYANINILSRGMWYSHPFSFSSACNGQYLRFTIKALGDYTNKIGNVPLGTHVIIDGPLGLFIKETSHRKKYLFIAGGIGITPIRAMIELNAIDKADMVLIYGSRTEKDITFKAEFDEILLRCPTLKIFHILGTPTPGYENGFINKDKIVRLIPDFFDREVFLCGPPIMMKLTVKNLKELGFDNSHMHYEKFSF